MLSVTQAAQKGAVLRWRGWVEWMWGVHVSGVCAPGCPASSPLITNTVLNSSRMARRNLTVDSVNQEYLRTAGGLDRFLVAMRVHRDSATVLESCFGAMCNLAIAPQNKVSDRLRVIRVMSLPSPSPCRGPQTSVSLQPDLPPPFWSTRRP